MTSFTPTSRSDRDVATAFVGRVAQLDPAGLVRLSADGDCVDLWSKAGFGVVATTRVRGRVDPDPMTVYVTNLVASLAISRSPDVDGGTDADAEWHTQLPPSEGWNTVGTLDGAEVAQQVRDATVVAEQAVRIDRAQELRAKTKATVPPVVLDRALLTVSTPQYRVPVSMRMLFALSGMGWVTDSADAQIGVAITRTWLRLDTPHGSVTRRRMSDLPLV